MTFISLCKTKGDDSRVFACWEEKKGTSKFLNDVAKRRYEPYSYHCFPEENPGKFYQKFM